MSEAQVSIQSENKVKESSSSTLVNNIIGGNNKEEAVASGAELKEAPASVAESRSPEPATVAAHANTNDAALDSNSNKNEKPTPAKRTPSKRLSFVERAQRESEELVKNLGLSLDIEGGRRTRSSTRGTPSRANAVATPPPAKKSRASAGTPRRGKGRKLDTVSDGEAVDSVPESQTTPPKTNVSSKEESNVESGENDVVDTVKSTDESNTEENTKRVKENDIDHTPEKKKDKPMDTSAVATTSKVVSEATKAAVKPVESKVTEGTISKEAVATKTSPIKLTSDVAVVKQQNKVTALVPHVTADDPSPTEPMEVDGDETSTAVEETKVDEKTDKIKQDKIISAESISKTVDPTPVIAAEIQKTNSIPEIESKALTNVPALIKNVPEENAVDRPVKDQVMVKSSEENNSSVKVDTPVKESSIGESVTPVGKSPITPTLAPLPQPTGAVAGSKNENSNLCEPKLSSPPPISTASETVSTPQYCN